MPARESGEEPVAVRGHALGFGQAIFEIDQLDRFVRSRGRPQPFQKRIDLRALAALPTLIVTCLIPNSRKLGNACVAGLGRRRVAPGL